MYNPTFPSDLNASYFWLVFDQWVSITVRDDSLWLKPRASMDFHQRSIALEQYRSVSCTEVGVTHRPLYRMARMGTR
jgi:hypothetical protein